MKFKEWYEKLNDCTQEYFTEKLDEVLKEDSSLEFTQIIEYGEELPVFFDKEKTTIVAFNEGGYRSVQIDAETLYEYLKRRFEND